MSPVFMVSLLVHRRSWNIIRLRDSLIEKVHDKAKSVVSTHLKIFSDLNLETPKLRPNYLTQFLKWMLDVQKKSYSNDRLCFNTNKNESPDPTENNGLKSFKFLARTNTFSATSLERKNHRNLDNNQKCYIKILL